MVLKLMLMTMRDGDDEVIVVDDDDDDETVCNVHSSSRRAWVSQEKVR